MLASSARNDQNIDAAISPGTAFATFELLRMLAPNIKSLMIKAVPDIRQEVKPAKMASLKRLQLGKMNEEIYEFLGSDFLLNCLHLTQDFNSSYEMVEHLLQSQSNLKILRMEQEGAVELLQLWATSIKKRHSFSLEEFHLAPKNADWITDATLITDASLGLHIFLQSQANSITILVIECVPDHKTVESFVSHRCRKSI